MMGTLAFAAPLRSLPNSENMIRILTKYYEKDMMSKIL